MDLILRKKDSVTSQILFIYNVFLWDKGIKRAPLSGLLNVLGHFGKSETSLRMALSRAVQNGFLVNEKLGEVVYYTLTESGISAIEGWRTQIGDYFKRFRLQHGWDGKWFIVNFNIPVEIEGMREKFVRFLVEKKFANLNKGVWISPYNYNQEIQQFCQETNISEYVFTFESELIDLERQDTLIKGLWDIEKAQQITVKFIEDFISSLDNFEKHEKEDQNDLSTLLPLLHEIGWRFMEIVQNDCQLPFGAYSNRVDSHEAITLFSNLRNALIKRVEGNILNQLDSKL